MKYLLIILVPVGIFVIGLLGFGMSSFFNPKYRQLEYKTFKESEQFRDGMTRQLEELHLNYVRSTNEDEKAIIKASFLHQVSEINKEHLTSELRDFYYSIK